MRNFFRFISRYHFLLLFLLLETLSFYFIFNYNQYQRSVYLSSSNQISGYLYEKFSSVAEYFELKQINEELARENTRLKNEQHGISNLSITPFDFGFNTAANDHYRYTSAKVINNSVNRHFNYLTLDKGTDDGIKPDMGVISSRGIVGVVLNSSKNYSTVISLLNTRLKISARLKKTGFFGSLEWEGGSYRRATLTGIPEHASPTVGDAVVTSGYSSIFPEDILIGTIEEADIARGGGFYNIKVLLSVDFKKLHYVQVVDKIGAEEQRKLEKMSDDD
ncbi:MAG: rod shape-determining protein MreC [Marinilabilia sp.]